MRPSPPLLLATLLLAASVNAAAEPLPLRLAGKSGYMDENGKLLVPLHFDEARRFSEGIAVVGLGPEETRLYGLIDLKGHSVLEPSLPRIENFAGGLALFAEQSEHGLRYGYLDREGKQAIPPRFAEAGIFSEGLAAVSEGAVRGWIGSDGNFRIVLPREAISYGGFHDGLAIISYSEADHRVIDSSGEEIYATSQRLAWRVGDGRIGAYSLSRGNYSYLAMPPGALSDLHGPFDYALPFAEGLAVVKPAGAALMTYLKANSRFLGSPRFRQARPFSEGLAAVMLDARWGYLDADGHLAIPPRFLSAGEFERGWAPVHTIDGPNFVDPAGRLAWNPANHPPTAEESVFFRQLANRELLELDLEDGEIGRLSSGGLISVHASDGEALAEARSRPGPELLLQGENRHVLFAVVEKAPALGILAGRSLLEDYQVSYLDADPLAESLGSARADSVALGALFLARRELPVGQAAELFARLPSRYLALRGLGLGRYPLFLDGITPLPDALREQALAPLPFLDATTGLWGYRDLAGRQLIPPTWAWAGDFDEGLAPVSPDSINIGFMDLKDGSLPIPPRFQGVGAFGEGLCMAIEAGMGGYIDRTGEWVITPRFAWSGAFREGLAPASLDGLGVGYIDREGDWVIEPIFQYGGEFGEGLATVVLEGATGYIDRQGKLVISCSYDEGTAFSNGLAAVRLRGLVAYIDHRGNERIPARFTAGTAFALGVALVSEEGRTLVIDRSGATLWQLDP